MSNKIKLTMIKFKQTGQYFAGTDGFLSAYLVNDPYYAKYFENAERANDYMKAHNLDIKDWEVVEE